MKTRIGYIILMAVCGIFFSGCVAIPPLINVQHRGDDKNIEKRLDSIERRLGQLENKVE